MSWPIWRVSASSGRNRSGRVAPSGGARFERLQPQLERRELLAHLVVELAGDADALLLLDDDEPAEQLVARLLGEPAFGHLGPQGLVRPGEVGGPFGHAPLQLLVRPEQRLLGPLPRGDVVEDRHRRDDGAARVADRGGADEHRPPVAVAPRESDLLVLDDLAGRQRPRERPLVGQVGLTVPVRSSGGRRSPGRRRPRRAAVARSDASARSRARSAPTAPRR